MSPDVFVLSNRHRQRDSFFVGHCFVGDDLIAGSAGYTQFSETGKPVTPGLDGAYTLVAPRGDMTVVGTDFAGYHRLFLYRSGSDWLVSNSFWQLTQAAADRRLPVTIAPAALASFQMPGSMGNQLSSSQTPVSEIIMISSRHEIQIPRNGSPHIVRTARAEQFDHFAADYPEALTEFLSVWRRRVRTILRSSLEVHSDLTGGRDSRAVFTLLTSAAESDDELRRVRFIGSKPGSTDDEVGATVLAGHGLGFQRAAPGTSLTTDESLAHWRNHSLGVYGPVYFARRARHDGQIHFGGGGGESHRTFYQTTDVRALFRARRGAFPSTELFEQAMSSAVTSVDDARLGFESDLDDATLHYRHFRDRLHCGRAPLAGNISLPLGSGYLAAASGLMPAAGRARAQVLADIMLNLDRDAAVLPFDHEHKNITAQHLDEMTDVRDRLDGIAVDEPGHVYSQPVEHATTTPASGRELYGRFAEMMHDAIPAARKLGVISEATISQAREASQSAVETGRLAHAIAGQPIATLILAGELARTARPRGLMSWLPDKRTRPRS